MYQNAVLKQINLELFVLRSCTEQIFFKNGINLAVPIFEHGFYGLFKVVL